MPFVFVALAAFGLAATGLFVLCKRRSTKHDMRSMMSPEDVFEMETRLRLVAVDEWMRSEAILHHTAARLSVSRVPVGAVDTANADAVRIVFSDGTTLVVEHPDPFAVAMLCRAAQGGRVMLRDLDGGHGHALAHFDVPEGALRLQAARMVVR